MKTYFPILALCILQLGCSALYREPQATYQPLVINSDLTKGDLFAKVVRALIAEGYTPAIADRELGLITSQRREMALGVDDVDLGTTMGINYVKDNRTTEFVTVTIQISDKSAEIRADIDGEYLPNDPANGKRMKGVSLGTVEKKIADRLK
jgi:hypothetical protein